MTHAAVPSVRTRNAQLALALAAVVALIVVLLLLRGGTGGRSDVRPSPSPTGAAAAASPTQTTSPAAAASPTATTAASPTATTAASPSPAGTAATSADHGYVVIGHAPPFEIRAESDGRVVRAINGHRATVSPDGRTIAYWKLPVSGGGLQALTLHTVATGAERELFKTNAGQQGAGIVWASDARGLLFSVETPRAPGGPPSGPANAELMTWDLTATQAQGRTTSELRLTDGRFWVPVAFDGPGQLAGAITSGEGGFALEYVTWDLRTQAGSASSLRFTRFPWTGVIAHEVSSSSDAKLVSVPHREANVLRIWPVNDIGAATEARRSGLTVGSAEWRPGAPREGALVAGSTVQAFIYQTDSARILYRAGGLVGIATWRADGSAVVVRHGDARVLVDYTSGESAFLRWADGIDIVDAVVLR